MYLYSSLTVINYLEEPNRPKEAENLHPVILSKNWDTKNPELPWKTHNILEAVPGRTMAPLSKFKSVRQILDLPLLI